MTLSVEMIAESMQPFGARVVMQQERTFAFRRVQMLTPESENTLEEDVLYVGDSYVDVLTAKNAALPCAGVLWGFGGEHSFDTEKPDFYIRTVKELETLILD